MSVEQPHRAIRVAVRGPDGRVEELIVDGERVLLGSGAHCEVRLPPENSSAEHVELTARDGRLWARALSLDPPPTLGQAPLVEAPVDAGAEIGLGALRITAALAGYADAGKKGASANKTSTVRMAAMAGAALLLLATLHDEKPKPLAPPPLALGAPRLWATVAEVCPRPTDQALAFAETQERAAEGKRERRAFYVHDGVAAVPLFEVAAACFAAAGDEPHAAEARQAVRELRARIEEDYHAHQVRLEHALAIRNAALAWHELSALRAMTEGLSGPYVAWLADVARSLRNGPSGAGGA